MGLWFRVRFIGTIENDVRHDTARHPFRDERKQFPWLSIEQIQIKHAS